MRTGSAAAASCCAAATCGCPCHAPPPAAANGKALGAKHRRHAHRSGLALRLGDSSDSPSASDAESFESRLDLLEGRLRTLAASHSDLQQQCAREAAQRRDEAEAKDELYRQLGGLVQTTSALTERLKTFESTIYESLRGSARAQEERTESLEADIVGLLDNFKSELLHTQSRLEARITASEAESAAQKQEVGRAVAQAAEAAVAAAAASASSHNQGSSSTAAVAELEASTRKFVANALDDFQRAQAQRIEDLSKRLDHELDKRHKRLIESTHAAVGEATKAYETAAPQIRTLQNDVIALRESARQHAAAIDAQRNDSSLEAALSELRDWVQDIERKIVSRTEVEETILSLTSQLSNLKHSTTTAEALLTQKIEVERSSRESAVAQLTTQLAASARRERRQS